MASALMEEPHLRHLPDVIALPPPLEHASQRLLPLVCFSCGQPVNNVQQTYDAFIAVGAPPVVAFKHLGIERLCCRTVLSQSASDTRLRRPQAERTTFTPITHLSKLRAPVFTLRADGTTAPVLPPR